MIGANRYLQTQLTEHFADRSKGDVPYCHEESGKYPAFFWGKKDYYISRKPHFTTDGGTIKGPTWNVYKKLNPIDDVDRKVLRLSKREFDRVFATTVLPTGVLDLSCLKLVEITCTTNKTTAVFTLNMQNTKVERVDHRAIFDFELCLPSSGIKHASEINASLFYLYKSLLHIQGQPIPPNPNNRCLQDLGAPLVFEEPAIAGQTFAEVLMTDPSLQIAGWKLAGKNVVFAKSDKINGSYCFAMEVNHEELEEELKLINKVYILTPSGGLIGQEGLPDLMAIALEEGETTPRLFPIEVSEESNEALFYLDISATGISPLTFLPPSERSCFAALTPKGLRFYICNHIFSERCNAMKAPFVEDAAADESVRTLDRKCFVGDIKKIFEAATITEKYSQCFELLGSKDGSPITFSEVIPHEERAIAPLKELLNRSYGWHLNGILVFYDASNIEAPWKIYRDNQLAAHSTDDIAIQDANGDVVEFTHDKDQILLLDSLRLWRFEDGGKKIVFQMRDQASSLDSKTPISPLAWTLTYVVFGKSDCKVEAHAQAYLETPTGQIIGIHLNNQGLHTYLVPELNPDESKRLNGQKVPFSRRAQVVSIRPRRALIENILKDFDAKIKLDGLQNCSVYVHKVFAYAGRPIAVYNKLNVFAREWNPLAHTAARDPGAKIVIGLQVIQSVFNGQFGRTTVAITEIVDGDNYRYCCVLTSGDDDGIVFSVHSGFRREVDVQLMAGAQRVEIAFSRTGIVRFLPWSTVRRQFEIAR